MPILFSPCLNLSQAWEFKRIFVGISKISAYGHRIIVWKLKYTIGLTSYHSYKSEYIEQEIWAKLIAYNASELLVQHTVTNAGDRKYAYSVNFTVAAHLCRIYLRLTAEIDSIDVMSLLRKELVPIFIAI